MNNALANVLRFFITLLIQVFVCMNIHLFGCVNAYIYLLALLMLPVELPRWVQYIIAFATGFIVDAFSMTYGIHASACLLMMFVRPYLITGLNGRKTSDTVERLTPAARDFRWILVYTVISVFIHQVAVVMLETWTFAHFWKTFLVIAGNTILTTTIILGCEYIFIPKKKIK